MSRVFAEGLEGLVLKPKGVSIFSYALSDTPSSPQLVFATHPRALGFQ